jgi:Outer membrane protein beta-barrel domain
MKKIILLISLMMIGGIIVSAQDYKKTEVYVGYSRGQVDGSTGRFFLARGFRETGPGDFNGAEIAGVYNFSRYVGLKADVSATYNGGDFQVSSGNGFFTGTTKNSLYNVLGGVQFKANSSERRLRPFAHILLGVGHARTDVKASCSTGGNTCTEPFIFPDQDETGFAGAFGGGLDIKLSDRFDLRAVQFDYNPVKLDSGTLHNARIGIGLVIK